MKRRLALRRLAPHPAPLPVAPVLTVLAVLALAGCHDSDDDDGPASFEPFVSNLIQAPGADTAEPIAIDGRSFAFSEAEGAFADVLPPDAGATVP